MVKAASGGHACRKCCWDCRAAGTEASFDGQPVPRGIHLRWSFLPLLGFPPGGFRLCRRLTAQDEREIPLPDFWDFGPLGVDLDAYLATLAAIQWSPLQIAGGLELHGDVQLP
jgi:hypothetical protein